MTIDELKVIISAETAEYKKALQEVQTSTKNTVNNVNKLVSALSLVFKKIGKVFSTAAIVTGLVKIGKASIKAASELLEVLNVVEVAFGSASSEIDTFASTAITLLGMSEYAAKKFASTFMAMSNGMGIVAEDGKTMSIQLTKLAGDMASFYDVDYEQSFTALKSVFTGETETLKNFGVVMTEANLKAYALSLGITKSYSAMTQAEKVALRYNFVLNATTNAQGDFARTADSWANQTRILAQQWNEFKSVIGSGLIAALTPVIKVVNQLLASLILVANKIRTIFGGKSGTSELSASVTTAEAGSAGVAENMEDAAKSAKDMKDAGAAGIDELSVLKGNQSGGGSTAAGGGVSASIESEAQSATSGELSAAEERIKSFIEKVLEIFSSKFAKLPELEINFDKEAAINDLESIGLNIANIIASWSSFAVEIGIKIANDLDIGLLGNDFLGLIESITGLASALSDVLTPAFLNFYDTGLSPIVEWIGSKVSDAIQTLSGWLDLLSEWLTNHQEDFASWGTTLGEIANNLFLMVEPIADAAWETFKSIMQAILDIFTLFSAGIITDFLNTIKKIVEVITTNEVIVAIIEGVAAAIVLVNGALAIYNGVVAVASAVTTIAAAAGTAFGAVIAFLTSPITLVIAAIAALIAAGILLYNHWDEVKAFAIETWEKIKTGITTAVENIKEKVSDTFTKLKESVIEIFEALKNGIKKPINGILGFINGLIKGITNGINKVIDALNSLSFEVPDWVPEIGGETFGFNLNHLVAYLIPLLKNGGVLNSGLLFMANEAGPELVGNVGNKTAVMNNSQIIDAVTNGVFNAVTAALGGNNTTEVKVYLDGKQLESSIRSTQQSRGAVIATGGLLNYA